MDRYRPLGHPRHRVLSRPHRNPGNVFIEGPLHHGPTMLVPIDFGHAVTFGDDLVNAKIPQPVWDSREVLGFFPEFRSLCAPAEFTDAINNISTLSRSTIEVIVKTAPLEWIQDPDRQELIEFLYVRSRDLPSWLPSELFPPVQQQLINP